MISTKHIQTYPEYLQAYKSYIRETLKEFDNYKLITNNICKDDLPKEINSISLANIDVDLYEATIKIL